MNDLKEVKLISFANCCANNIIEYLILTIYET
jgi:hypothetical protein